MKRRHAFFALFFLSLAGCGDSATTILRAGANQKSELTDRLSKVSDEASARIFIDRSMKEFNERLKNLNDKWEKWIKSIEDDYKPRESVLPTTKHNPGTPEWEQDMRTYSKKMEADVRFAEAREAFIAYVRNITADDARLGREKARIAALVNQLVEEERAKGGDRASANEICPNLVKINASETFKNAYLKGAKRVIIE